MVGGMSILNGQVAFVSKGYLTLRAQEEEEGNLVYGDGTWWRAGLVLLRDHEFDYLRQARISVVSPKSYESMHYAFERDLKIEESTFNDMNLLYWRLEQRGVDLEELAGRF